MAIILFTQYPGKAIAPDANYPQGKARNVTISGDGTGTPWEQELVNDILGLLQAILLEGGITPSGSPDTALASDYLDGLKEITNAISTSYVLTAPAGGDLRTFNPNTASLGQTADVLATLIKDLNVT